MLELSQVRLGIAEGTRPSKRSGQVRYSIYQNVPYHSSGIFCIFARLRYVRCLRWVSRKVR